jgi:hypothetical protein
VSHPLGHAYTDAGDHALLRPQECALCGKSRREHEAPIDPPGPGPLSLVPSSYYAHVTCACAVFRREASGRDRCSTCGLPPPDGVSMSAQAVECNGLRIWVFATPPPYSRVVVQVTRIDGRAMRPDSLEIDGAPLRKLAVEAGAGISIRLGAKVAP